MLRLVIFQFHIVQKSGLIVALFIVNLSVLGCLAVPARLKERISYIEAAVDHQDLSSLADLIAQFLARDQLLVRLLVEVPFGGAIELQAPEGRMAGRHLLGLGAGRLYAADAMASQMLLVD